MAKKAPAQMSRRERQVMDILYRREEATAAEVLDDLPDPPSYSTVRTLLKVLEAKGHVRHKYDGPRYVYRPTISRDKAKRSALEQLLGTFFEGSVEKAMATLLDLQSLDLSEAEFDRMSNMIEKAKKERHS